MPQWNCGCAGCLAARSGEAKPRTQSSVAVSADGVRWFLLNASPDVRFQIEAFAPLWPPPGSLRGSGVDRILLTNADLDHTLGLALLREGRRLSVVATGQTREALEHGLRLPTLLGAYGGADFTEPPLAPTDLAHADGSPSGLRFCAVPVAGKPPRYLEGRAPHPLDNIGYWLQDLATGGRLLFLPDVGAVDSTLRTWCGRCEALLFDGTFWSEAELVPLGGRPAAGMAHLPVGGPRGSLAFLAALSGPRRIYLHLNNTNPMLRAGSPERAQVLASGIEIGEDGWELSL